jgi:hypothetical protein
MTSRKYLKNSLDFDLIYRSTPKNAHALPFVKKSSFLVSDISSLSKTLSSANAIKVLSSSANPKISVASVSMNEFSIRKGDPVSCNLTLGKHQALNFMSFCSLAFSSMAAPTTFSININKGVVPFPFTNSRYFFPFTFYESSFLVTQRSNMKLSMFFYFSKPLISSSICLFSAYFPFFGQKKNTNNFRTILREIEQSG